MGDYNIVSQMQGPTVPIQLFPEAMATGAQVGNAVKTPLQAVAEGISSGIQNYQVTQKRAMDLELEQAQIDQAPLDTAIKRQQLENDIAITQNNQLALAKNTATQTDVVAAENAKNKRELEIINSKQNIEQSIADLNNRGITDPQAWRNVLTDPKSQAAFSDNTFAQQVYGRVAGARDSFGNPIQPPNIQKSLLQQVDFLKAMEFQNAREIADSRAHEQLANKYQEDLKKFSDDVGLRSIFAGQKMSDINRYEVYAAGTVNVDPTTNKILKGQGKSLNFADKNTAGELFKDGVKLGITLDHNQSGLFLALKDSYSRTYPEPTFPSAASGTPTPQTSPAPAAPAAPTDNAQTGTTPTANVNNNIALQKRKEFDALARTNPPGIVSGSLEDRLKVQKQLIRSRYAATPEAVQAVQQKAQMQQTYATSNPSPTPVPVEQALSSVVGKPVKLNTEVTYTPKQTTWQRITTSPLVGNEPAVIQGLASVESKGISDAVSTTGVRGMLQVEGSTAAQYGLDTNIPSENVLAGKLYLFDMLAKFKGNIRLALTAYNAGPKYVDAAVEAAGSTEWSKVRAELKKSLSDFKFSQAENYADKVISASAYYVRKDNPADQLYVQILKLNGLLSING